MNGKKLQKKRGIFLTVMIGLYLFWILYTANHFLFWALKNPDTPQMYIVEQVVALPLHIAIFIGLLKWKKWAVYGFFILPNLQIIFKNVMIYLPRSYEVMILRSFLGITLLSLLLLMWVWPFKRKWQFFE